MKADFWETHQVFIDYAITGGKESQNMGYKVSLLRLQGLPVLNVLGEIHLKFRSSQGTLSVWGLAHIPNSWLKRTSLPRIAPLAS